ncbi:hypothetical protein ACSMXM_09715 [Pacificimonas sp. ICDLI1SI03]
MIYQFFFPALYWLALIICGIYVLKRGGSLERRVLWLLVCMSVLSVLVSMMDDNRFHSTGYGLLALDLLLLAILMRIALTSARYWPIWAAGFHMISVITHLAVMAVPDLVPTAYALVQGLWAYPVFASLALGARWVSRGWVPDETLRRRGAPF